MQIKKLMALLAAGALALSAASVSAGPAKGEKEKKESKASAKDAKADKPAADPNQFDNWRLNCEKPEGMANEVCELAMVFQSRPQPAANQAVDPNAKPTLVMKLSIVKPVNNEFPIMVIHMPLGAFLQPAPMMKVPGHKDVVVQFLTCNPNGLCNTQPVALEKEFVDALRATEAATTKDAKAPGATISIGARQTTAEKQVQHGYLPINWDVKGFGKGLDALLKKAAANAPKK